jgi:flagellar biosynthesis protein FlhB
LYLSFFLVAHLFAVMGGRYYLKLDTNFYFGASPLLSWLWWYYVPYYGLSVIAVFAHVASTHFQKMLPRTSLKKAQIQALAIAVIGCTIAVMILIAFSGVLYSIVLPAGYQFMPSR